MPWAPEGVVRALGRLASGAPSTEALAELAATVPADEREEQVGFVERAWSAMREAIVYEALFR